MLNFFPGVIEAVATNGITINFREKIFSRARTRGFVAVVTVLKHQFGDVISTITALGVTKLGREGLKIEIEVTKVLPRAK